VKDILAKEALDVLVFAEIGMDPHSYALAFGRYAPIQIVMHGIPQPYPSTLPLNPTPQPYPSLYAPLPYAPLPYTVNIQSLKRQG
jgi:hypothetical protein